MENQNPCIDTDFIFCTRYDSPYRGTVQMERGDFIQEYMYKACNFPQSYGEMIDKSVRTAWEQIETAYRNTHWCKYVGCKQLDGNFYEFALYNNVYSCMMGFVAIPKSKCDYTPAEADLALSLFVESCFNHYKSVVLS